MMDMHKPLYYVCFLVSLILLSLTLGFAPRPTTTAPPMTLSEYGFFTGDLAAQEPAPGLIPYTLNTPLFTDYAEKLRFIRLPAGATVSYNDREVLDFPVGTVIIKTFYYPIDARKPDKGRRLMETRLLIHEPAGWQALPYHWNEDQTDAYLEVAGDMKPVKWIDASGNKRKVTYVMPNLNQCKGCHSLNGQMTPIGPSARQLNGEFAYASGPAPQLQHWAAAGWLTGLPSQAADIPRLAVWDDPHSGDLDARARAWLDINCAHCHRAEGPAKTSGLFLDIHQTDPSVLGVNKPPVAAGRGSGGLQFDIVPGQPEASILYHRMASTDPGVMMPELGRQLVHAEGLALIRDWITHMPSHGGD